MFEWLRHKRAAAPDRLSNRRVLVRPARVVRGRYDAAQTTDDNRKHWMGADFLAALGRQLALVCREDARRASALHGRRFFRFHSNTARYLGWSFSFSSNVSVRPQEPHLLHVPVDENTQKRSPPATFHPSRYFV